MNNNLHRSTFSKKIVLMSRFCCNQHLIDNVIKSKKDHSKRNNLNVDIVKKGFLKANDEDSCIHL